MMAGSAYAYFTSPDMVTAFQHLGFPSYFRQQPGVFKHAGTPALCERFGLVHPSYNPTARG